MNLDLPKLRMRMDISIYDYVYVLKRNSDYCLNSSIEVSGSYRETKPSEGRRFFAGYGLEKLSDVAAEDQNFSRV